MHETLNIKTDSHANRARLSRVPFTFQCMLARRSIFIIVVKQVVQKPWSPAHRPDTKGVERAQELTKACMA